MLRYANVDLMLLQQHFETGTSVFRTNAEQSKLTVLNNKSKSALKTCTFFFCAEHEKSAKVLHVLAIYL